MRSLWILTLVALVPVASLAAHQTRKTIGTVPTTLSQDICKAIDIGNYSRSSAQFSQDHCSLWGPWTGSPETLDSLSAKYLAINCPTQRVTNNHPTSEDVVVTRPPTTPGPGQSLTTIREPETDSLITVINGLDGYSWGPQVRFWEAVDATCAAVGASTFSCDSKNYCLAPPGSGP